MPTPFVVLYFVFQPGCHACAAAEPELEAWRRTHGYRPAVIKLNVALKDWSIGDWRPGATPAYLVTVNRQPVAQHEGALSAAQLNEWYVAAASGNPVEIGEADEDEADAEDEDE